MNQRSGARRYLGLAGLGVAVVLVLLVIALRETERPLSPPSARSAESAQVPTAALRARGPSPDSTPMVSDTASASHQRWNGAPATRLLHFRVTDIYGNPLPLAEVLLAGRTYFSAPTTAACNLELPYAGLTLSVHCAGYISAEIDVESGDTDFELDDVRLTAKETLLVTVTTEEQEPVAGAEIWLLSQDNNADALAPGATWFSAGVTNGSGMLSVERGASGYSVLAAKGNARSAVGAVAPQESEVALELALEPNLRLLLVDGEGVPVRSLPLQLRVQRATASPDSPVFTFEAASNDQGRIEARLPKGQYSLQLGTLEWYQREQADHSLRIGTTLVERTIVLRRVPGVDVRAIDVNTGAAVREFAGWIFPDRPKPPLVVRGFWPHKKPTASFLRVPCWLPLPAPPGASLFLVIKAEGYPAACREIGRVPQDQEVTVELEPGQPLRLRFTDDHGRPWPDLHARLQRMGSSGQVSLKPDNRGERGYTDSEGILELRGWEDGIWSVQTSYREGTFFHAARLALPEDGLSHHIRLPRPGWIEGEIVGVEAADECPRIVAVDRSGVRIPASIQDNRYRVPDLAPGAYWIAVDEALHNLSYCLHFDIDVGTKTIVEPGKATVLDFDLETMGAWRLAGSVNGLDDQQHWLAVVPVVTGRPFFLRPENLVPLAADGSFLLRTGSLGGPTALLCVVTENEFGVLLPTLCEEISTAESLVFLHWEPGRLRIVDADGIHETFMIERVDDRLLWHESAIPTNVDLTLAPGTYRLPGTKVVVDVTPAQVTRVALE